MALIQSEHEAELLKLAILILLPSIKKVFDKPVNTLQYPIPTRCG